jgi:phosphomannomutase / phosphoglucomutase
MKANREIFKTYDIRGIYPTDLNDDLALHLGKAFGTVLRRKGLKSCVVGMDNRKSSTPLISNFVKGMLSTGCDVTNVGITLSPVIYFFTCVAGFDSGVNITASHNPKQYNGLKFVLADAVPFFGEDLLRLCDLVEIEDYETGEGVYQEKDLLPLYIEYMKHHFSFNKDTKVVINCGSGATSEIAPRVLTALGCSLATVHCNLDSSFPHGVPDPESKQYMAELESKVKEFGADVGFAFDTDGDRVGVADEHGKTYENDRMMLLYAKELLKKHPGATMIYDVKCSQVLEKEIAGMGGVPKMIRTGRTFFSKEMRNGAILGCEFSGHTYFAGDYFGYDDGLYAVCMILKTLESSDKPLSELLSGFPKRTSTPEIKVMCEESKKYEVMKSIVEHVTGSGIYLNVSTVDGVRVTVTETGWFLIRASNTAPYLSVRVEGIDEAEVVSLLESVATLLSAHELQLETSFYA